MPLDGGVAVGGEVDETLRLIDALDGALARITDHHPLAGGDGPQQLAVEIVEIEVLVAAAIGRPEEGRLTLQEGELVVQFHPGVAAFLEQLLRGAAGHINFKQFQALLVAGLALYGERTRIREPGNAGEVAVACGGDRQFAQGRCIVRGVRPGRNPKIHACVRTAGCGVTLADQPHRLGVDLEAFDLVHGRLIDARERDHAFIGRPPVAGIAVHLLLGDEFSHAEGHEPRAFACDRDLATGGDLDDIEVLRTHEAHIASAGRKPRVRLRSRRARQAAHRRASARRLEIVEEEIPGDRDQQQPRVGRELVVDDASEGDGALPLTAGLFLGRERPFVGDQAARVDEQRVASCGDVVGPEVEPVLGLGAALQVGDKLAVRRESGAAQRGAGKIRAVEEPLEGQALGRFRSGRDGGQDAEGEEGDERQGRAIRHGRYPSSNMGA